MRTIAILAGLAAACLGVCAAGVSQGELRKRLQDDRDVRILFVGNSYSVQLPKIFEKLGNKSGRQVVVGQVTKGGWTLKKHATSEETLERIRSGDWDVVVLQEQSQLPSFSRGQREKEMIPHAVTLAAEVRKAGAVPVFFQTWGRRDGDTRNAKAYPDDTFAKMQGRLETGYREAAKAAGDALVVPVGRAWSEKMAAGKGAPLFAKDGSHPSAAGVALSANVFWEFFFGK